MQTRCAAEFPSLTSLARRAALASLAGLVFAPAVFLQDAFARRPAQRDSRRRDAVARKRRRSDRDMGGARAPWRARVCVGGSYAARPADRADRLPHTGAEHPGLHPRRLVA